MKITIQILGIKHSQNPSKYLGIPSNIGKNKSNLFTYIEDKATRKIQGWKEKLLTQAS